MVIRYPKACVPDPEMIGPECNTAFELGKSIEIGDISTAMIIIVSYGSVLPEAVKARDILLQRGIDTGIVNARFAAPLDKRISQYLNQGKKIITVEDHSCACGFGSAVLESAAASHIPNARIKDIRIIGIPKTLIKHSSREQQFKQVGLNAEKIAAAARDMIEKSPLTSYERSNVS